MSFTIHGFGLKPEKARSFSFSGPRYDLVFKPKLIFKLSYGSSCLIKCKSKSRSDYFRNRLTPNIYHAPLEGGVRGGDEIACME